MPRKTQPGRPLAIQPMRFNEAAARCRGKPGEAAAPGAGGTGFNEAAARCRGKLRLVEHDVPAVAPLQ